MQTTDITCKESDLDVVLGDHTFGEDPREEALCSLKYLYSDLTDIRNYYIRLGFHLKEFRFCEYYKDFGFLTFEDFCDVNLGMDKGAVSRCINVYEQFNASNDIEYKAGIKTVGCSMYLSEKWKDYSYTQLCEMLPLSENERNNITPDMTVSQIRDYKKQLKQDRSAKDAVALTQPDEKEPFNFVKYLLNQGIVRQNLVKNCSAISEDAVFYIFDENGKQLDGGSYCDLIYKDKDHFFFRLRHSCDEGSTN